MHPGYRTSVVGKNCAYYIRILMVCVTCVYTQCRFYVSSLEELNLCGSSGMAAKPEHHHTLFDKLKQTSPHLGIK